MSYKSIGKILIKKNYINKNNVNLFTIKKWLRANPTLSKEILHQNKRFIFFKEMSFGIDKHPVGAFGTPLNQISVLQLIKIFTPWVCLFSFRWKKMNLFYRLFL